MILHVDMDAFYASIEERDDPSLVGHPVIVGGVPDQRGVVAAANYEARRYGVHSAMASATAYRLCPHAIVLPPRLDYYAEVSCRIRAIFERFTPLVEPLSLDEAFLDVSGSIQLFGTPETIGKRIKEEIRDELRLVASVGIAPNKFLAKIASDLQKPDGFVVVAPDAVQSFLDPLPVGRLWGVGRATNASLQRLGIETIGQLRALSSSILEQISGQLGMRFWQLAHGVDNRKVVPDREAKTISHETTFASDISDVNALRVWLWELTEQVARRLRRHELKGRTVHLKIRSHEFRTLTRARTLARPTDVTQEVWQAVAELLDELRASERFPVRLLGVGVSNLQKDAKAQLGLFDSEEHLKQRQLDKVADSIRDRYGANSIKRGTRLRRDGTPDHTKQPANPGFPQDPDSARHFFPSGRRP
ncbi:MAG TPA: DNA polymerase IV [Pirellulales bacterium]|nr:DNA polymerase IV [Pirellulales bacterium]